MSAAFTAVNTTANPAERVADIDEAVLDARRLAWNASNMHDAAGYGRLDRLIEALYTERDAITAVHPRADAEGRILAYRRRVARGR